MPRLSARRYLDKLHRQEIEYSVQHPVALLAAFFLSLACGTEQHRSNPGEPRQLVGVREPVDVSDLGNQVARGVQVDPRHGVEPVAGDGNELFQFAVNLFDLVFLELYLLHNASDDEIPFRLIVSFSAAVAFHQCKNLLCLPYGAGIPARSLAATGAGKPTRQAASFQI